MWRKIVLGLLIAGALADAVDRIALALWRYRVNAFYRSLVRSQDQQKRVARTIYDLTLSSSGTRGRWQVPLLEVRLSGPMPTVATVDGNGGLDLMFAPPLLAWSRYLPYLNPQRQVIQGADLFPYNDVYILKIRTLEDRPGGHDLPKPVVTLDHGLPF